MEFREAIQADFDYMADHSVSRGIQKHCPEQTDYVYTLEHEGVVLGIGGFKMINVTTAWVWADLSSDASSHIKTVHRVMTEWMAKFCKDHGIVRLECYVEKNFPEAIRMVTHLGFEEESTMEKFMGDKDAFLYKRII